MALRTAEQKALDFEKVRKKCPCAFVDDRHYVYPPIDCEMKCNECGWNPKEQSRRIRSGNLHYNRITKIRKLYFSKKGKENK